MLEKLINSSMMNEAYLHTRWITLSYECSIVIWMYPIYIYLLPLVDEVIVITSNFPFWWYTCVPKCQWTILGILIYLFDCSIVTTYRESQFLILTRRCCRRELKYLGPVVWHRCSHLMIRKWDNECERTK